MWLWEAASKGVYLCCHLQIQEMVFFCRKKAIVTFSIPCYLLKPCYSLVKGIMCFPSSVIWMSSVTVWWMGCREVILWLLRRWGFHLAHYLGTNALGPRPLERFHAGALAGSPANIHQHWRPGLWHDFRVEWRREAIPTEPTKHMCDQNK